MKTYAGRMQIETVEEVRIRVRAATDEAALQALDGDGYEITETEKRKREVRPLSLRPEPDGEELVLGGDEVYRCPVCGCGDVQGTAWIVLNTGRLADGDPPSEDIYCPKCDDTSKRVCIVRTTDNFCTGCDRPFADCLKENASDAASAS